MKRDYQNIDVADYIRTNNRRLLVLCVCTGTLALLTIFACVAGVWFFVVNYTGSSVSPPLSLSDFVWVNQEDNNATQNEAGIFLYSPIPPSGSSNQYHFTASMLLQPLNLSPPWSAQMKFSMQSNYNDIQQVFMLVLRNDTTQAAFSFGLSSEEGAVYYTWTSPTSPSPPTGIAGPVFTSITYFLWLRISCDGQQYYLATGFSGYDWVTWGAAPMNTTVESPSSVGFLLSNDYFQPGAAAPIGVQVWSFSVTSS